MPRSSADCLPESATDYDSCVVPQIFNPDSPCAALLGVESFGVSEGCTPLDRVECTRELVTQEDWMCLGNQRWAEHSECSTLIMLDARREALAHPAEYRMEPRTSFSWWTAEIEPTSERTRSPLTARLASVAPRDRVSEIDYASWRSIQSQVRDPSFWGDWAYDETWYGPDGDDAQSCVEYVYEKYFDVTRFEDAIRNTHDPRAIWSVAFGPMSNTASIGTRHQSDPTLRARAVPGSTPTSFGSMWPAGETQPRNFFYLADGTTQNVLAGRLERLAGTGDPVIARYRAGTSSITPSFAWYGGAQQALTHPSAGLARISPAETPGDRTTGYSDEELEYLWDLQQRFVAVLDQIAAMPIPPCVHSPDRDLEDAIAEMRDRYRSDPPGWGRELEGIDLTRISDVIGSGVIDRGMISRLNSTSLRPNTGGIVVVRRDLGSLSAGVFNRAPVDTSIDFNGIAMTTRSLGTGCSPEVVAEVRAEQDVLYREALLLVQEADRWGCFRSGLGPCDFSYSRFAREITDGRFEDAQERDYTRCIAHYTNPWAIADSDVLEWPGDLNHDGVLNATDCGGDASRVRASNTISGITGSPDAIEFAMALVEGERRHRQQCIRGNAIAEIRRRAPDLVAPSGELRPPGFDYSGREQMGDRGLFALGYDYHAKFGLDGFYDPNRMNEDECNAPLGGSAGFNATLTAYNQDFPLIRANASSTSGTASIWLIGYGDVVNATADEASTARHIVATTGWQETVASGVVVVLGVPVRFTAGAAGSVGFEASAHAASQGPVTCGFRNAGLHFQPSARLEGFLTASADIGIARAGVKGRLTIIQADLPFDVTASIQGAAGSRSLVVSADGRLQLSTLSGRVSAFAEIGVGPFSTGAEATIFEWRGPSWNTPLFHQEYTLPWSLVQQAY